MQLITMNNPLTDKTRPLLKKAEEHLTQSGHYLHLFQQESQDFSDDSCSDAEMLKSLILTLQYRLDTQSALSQLGRLQQYILHLLGIEAQHSLETNMERLAYALGTDELKFILSQLNHLIDSLLRIVAQQSVKKAPNLSKSRPSKSPSKLEMTIQKTLDLQRDFTDDIHKLQLVLEETPGIPNQGLILDHIAALQGPVSRFEQALLNGLMLSGGLYQQLLNTKLNAYIPQNTRIKLAPTLNPLPIHSELQRLFKPTQEEQFQQKLEQRAAEKRLGHFFYR